MYEWGKESSSGGLDLADSASKTVWGDAALLPSVGYQHDICINLLVNGIKMTKQPLEEVRLFISCFSIFFFFVVIHFLDFYYFLLLFVVLLHVLLRRTKSSYRNIKYDLTNSISLYVK
jgi:hypothetical protein